MKQKGQFWWGALAVIVFVIAVIVIGFLVLIRKLTDHLTIRSNMI